MTLRSVLALSLSLLFLQACSLSTPEQRRVRLEIPPAPEQMAKASQKQPGDVSKLFGLSGSLSSLGTLVLGGSAGTAGSSSDTPPTSLDDMTCFAINVSGSGIARDGRMFCKNEADFIGISGGMVSATAGGIIDLMVPTGSERRIQLMGFKTAIGCPSMDAVFNAAALEQNGGPSMDQSLGGHVGPPWFLGETSVAITDDTTVTIQAKYDPATPIELFQSCGKPGTSSELTVTISRSPGQAQTATGLPVEFSIIFSRPVNPATFDSSDLVQSGSATGVNWTLTDSGDHMNYTLRVDSAGEGSILPIVPAARVQDTGGVANSDSISQDTGVLLDQTAPTISLTPAVAGPTASSPIPFLLMFSEPVTGLEAADFTVSNGSVSGVTMNSPNSYTVYVVPGSNGAVTLSLNANTTQDGAGNFSPAAGPASILFDSVGPTVTISSTATALTNQPIPVAVTFSDSVTGLTASDFTIGNGTISGFTGGGPNYTFMVIPTDQGAVTVDLPAGAAHDDAGNGNLVATALSRDFDSQAPSVTFNSAASANVNTQFTVTATFSEPVSGLTGSDFAIGNGTISGFTGSGANYTFLVTPAAQGYVTVNLPAGAAQDAAGNGNLVATELSRYYDSAPPSMPTISFPQAGQPILSTSILVKGSCEAGATVSVAFTTGPGTAGTAACVSGYFSVSVAVSGSNGMRTLSATQADATGNVSSAGSVSFNFIKTFKTTPHGAGGYIGLPDAVVQRVSASTGGVLVATRSGLGKSVDNGINWTTLTTRNGLPTNVVRDVAQNTTGEIIAAATEHGLAISSNYGATFTSFTTGNGLAENWVSRVAYGMGTIYAINGDGVSFTPNLGTTFDRWNGGTNGLPNNPKAVAAFGGWIAVGTPSGVAVSSDGGGSWNVRTTANGLVSNDVRDVWLDSPNTPTVRLLVATGAGISVISDIAAAGTLNFASVDAATTFDSITSNGTHVFAAGPGGVAVSDSSVSSFTLQTLGQSHSVAAYGSYVYAGMNGGGLKVSPDLGVMFSGIVPTSLNAPPVHSIAKDVSGNLYFATQSQTFISSDGGLNFGAPSIAAIALYYDSTTSTLYGGSNGWGLQRFGSGVFSSISAVTGVVNGVVAEGSVIYAATSDGLRFSTNGVNFSTAMTVNGVFNINGFLKDGTDLWVATSAGLSKTTWGSTTFSHLTTADGLSSNQVNKVYRIGGKIVAATASGLSIWDGASFTNKGTGHGLLRSEVTSIAYHNGTWILGHPGGGGVTVCYENCQVIHAVTDLVGLPAPEVPTVYVDPDTNRIFLGTHGGLGISE